MGGLYWALPTKLAVRGVRWLPLGLVSLLLVPTIVSHQRGQHRANRFFGLGVAGVVTIFTILSLALLIKALVLHPQIEPPKLLRSAAALWVTNVLVFALWYWHLDAGGPHRRDRRKGHPDGEFLFPQTIDGQAAGVPPTWSPNFAGYSFLSFSTSTAFSPLTPAWSRVGQRA